MSDTHDDIDEVLEPTEEQGGLRTPKPKKLDPVGISYYGESFTGYQKIEEYRDLIPAFKDFYYTEKLKDSKKVMTRILREYNVQISSLGRKFHPYTKVIGAWKKKWDADILEKKGMMVAEVTSKKNIQQILKTRAQGENGIVEFTPPTYGDLELATQTLGGELVNDAIQMLRDDQNMEDIYESDELVKRKAYVVNVFSHVTKLVHGKSALLLKASQEKRENAGFLMELMKKATAGKMSPTDVAALRGTYQPVVKEATHVA